jgi:predicted double-glycine peptidase
VDRDGVCRQSNGYTCGPAAAVTALRQFGITAEEGDLAVLARTSDALGTPPDVLANVLKRRYRDEGIAAHYRYMRDLSEVKPGDVFIAVVYFDFTTDHYVTVIEVHDDRLVVGDPLSGKRFMSREAFLNIWQRTGVVLRRS